VLNQSVYVTAYEENKEDPSVIHTGFTFKSHKDKQFELLYDLDTEIIIWQVRNEGMSSIPQMNGILITKNGESYFNAYYNIVRHKLYEQSKRIKNDKYTTRKY